MDDPQYIVLVALDTPSSTLGINVSGGVMGALTARGVLEDILPYLGVSRDYTDVDVGRIEVTMPTLTDFTEAEAKKALEECSLTYRVVGSGDTVTDQIPAGGVSVPGNSEVILYMGESAPTEVAVVPDFRGMSVSQANAAATNAGLYLLPMGTDKTGSEVKATTQSIEAGVEVARGTMVKVEFTDHTADE